MTVMQASQVSQSVRQSNMELQIREFITRSIVNPLDSIIQKGVDYCGKKLQILKMNTYLSNNE